MDAIYTYRHYTEDSRPRLQFPKRTGRRTTYAQWLAYQYALHHDDALPAIGFDAPLAPAFVNHGRWLWQCPACMTAVQVSETAGAVDLCCCPACFGQGFVLPSFPHARAEIEAELLRQPGYRHSAPFRNWEPGWSLAYLRDRTAAAQAKLDAGETFVRSASIGTPRTWSVGEVLTAANMNTFVREIQKDLSGINGPIELENALVLDSLTTAERNALTPMDGMQLYNSTTGRTNSLENGEWRRPLRAVESSLYAWNVNGITISHTLGVIPLMYQMFIERVGATVTGSSGFTPIHGARYVIPQPYLTGQLNRGWQVQDATPTQFTVRSNLGGVAIIYGTGQGLAQAANVDNDTTSMVVDSGWAFGIIAIG